ncbi:hypothetical protein [Luteithermobacter gelatinilyticus]|uniref:hypothetical protein n=1 Tax=Luteithermobacter gelatinilyticus TaxID=2582913 RepID=UPI00110663A9|nr:hypothetical protein [Luteithermobacter gelatinilyticus]|tara:strand:- start:2032 stop:2616 length:585 start_codon:yes stop_codon:yes gene_type:complete
MRYPVRFLLLCILAALAASRPASAEDKKIVIPCGHPVFRVFDFWVGDWQVFHRDSGKLAGFDRIGRTLGGCALQQSWISLDDHFSSPYVPFRMNGKSLTAFNGTEWVQFWVDNQAGMQLLRGGPEEGAFVLRSQTPVGGYLYRISWTPQEDGTIHNISERRKVDDGTWETVFDFIYRRNGNAMPSPEEPSEESE